MHSLISSSIHCDLLASFFHYLVCFCVYVLICRQHLFSAYRGGACIYIYIYIYIYIHIYIYTYIYIYSYTAEVACAAVQPFGSPGSSFIFGLRPQRAASDWRSLVADQAGPGCRAAVGEASLAPGCRGFWGVRSS